MVCQVRFTDPWRVPERCGGEEKRDRCVPSGRVRKALGGTDAIRSILIANNGMAAVKFMRSVRSWVYESFGAERVVLLVAMATPEDMRINAGHIRMADQFVEALLFNMRIVRCKPSKRNSVIIEF